MPITFYKAIILKYELCGRSFLDIDPSWGEKSIASVMCDCEYYYVETCPFDTVAENIASYFNKKFIIDDLLKRYDFSIVDFKLKFNLAYYKYIMDNYRNRIDLLMMLVPLKHENEVYNLYKCDDKIAFYINDKLFGYFFVYR